MNRKLVSDQELVNLYIHGDESALGELLTRHKTKIYSSINLLVKDSFLAEDFAGAASATGASTGACSTGFFSTFCSTAFLVAFTFSISRSAFSSSFSSFVFLSGRVFEFTFARSILPTILTLDASDLISGTTTVSGIGATAAGLGAFGALDVTFLIKISFSYSKN
jgi:hypothetical protein